MFAPLQSIFSSSLKHSNPLPSDCHPRVLALHFGKQCVCSCTRSHQIFLFIHNRLLAHLSSAMYSPQRFNILRRGRRFCSQGMHSQKDSSLNWAGGENGMIYYQIMHYKTVVYQIAKMLELFEVNSFQFISAPLPWQLYLSVLF